MPRKGLSREAIIDTAAALAEQKGAENLTLRELAAVSYTHLDVYKRQPHIRPLVSLALDIGQAHRAFLLFQIGQQFNDRPRVQPQMIVCGQQAAELPLGQRPAERGLRALADGREAVVVHRCV